jgi:hypothetical protein
VIVLANTREDVEKEAGMIISQELLRETEDRYKQREEPREENVQKIEAGKVLEANSLRLVQKRLERLAHAEVPGGLSAEAVATTVPGAQPDSTDTFGIALERIIGKSDLIGVHYLDLGMIVSRSVGRIQVRTSTGQLQGYGTGFMVSPRLLLTNNHVLGSVGEASNSWVAILSNLFPVALRRALRVHEGSCLDEGRRGPTFASRPIRRCSRSDTARTCSRGLLAPRRTSLANSIGRR